MAILDSQERLSNEQAVTATAVSTNTFDSKTARRLFEGNPLYVCITVTETVTSAGSSTVTFAFVSDDNASLSSPSTIVASSAIAKANLTAGTKFYLAIPPGVEPGGPAAERYFGMNYTVAVANLTAGKFTAYITANNSGFTALPSSYVAT